jgi:stage II sporulation protein M
MVYEEIWEFIKESRNYFFIALGLFAISALIGFIFPIFFIDIIKKLIEDLASRTAGMNFFQLFIYIFENNLQTAFTGIILGILFGIFPLIIVLFNGYVLGFVANKAVAVAGASVLLRLLPHGIFEIPALILSLGLGLRLGMFIFHAKDKNKAIISFVVSLLSFIIISSIFLGLLSLMGIINLNAPVLNNIIFSLLFFIIEVAILFFSYFLGTRFLSKKDRTLVFYKLKLDSENSLRVFLYIILPLLLIAAIIETGLIILLK